MWQVNHLIQFLHTKTSPRESEPNSPINHGLSLGFTFHSTQQSYRYNQSHSAIANNLELLRPQINTSSPENVEAEETHFTINKCLPQLLLPSAGEPPSNNPSLLPKSPPSSYNGATGSRFCAASASSPS